MNELLLTLLEEFQAKINAYIDGVEREVKFPNMANKIMVAIGMRRTGKSYFLLQTIKKLLQQEQIALSRILYVNFEDNRLYPLTANKLSDLLDSFYSLYPENHDQLCYLFLDEIQNIDNWQTTIRRYFDSKQVKIYITGSSAKLLSKEIATSLRGRSIATEMWPFSFTEFLQAKDISLPATYGRKSLDKIQKLLKIYLKQGGFPETVGPQRISGKQMVDIWKEFLGIGHVGLDQNFFELGGDSLLAIKLISKLIERFDLNISIKALLGHPTINLLLTYLNNFYIEEDENRIQTLQNYFSVVVLRDVIERHKITNNSLIHYLSNFLLKNAGCSFSVHKFYNDIKSQGFSVSKTTIHDYLDHIEDACLAFTVPLYSESLRQTQSNPRKIYVIDTGLINACTFGFSENIGHYFENLIYLDLRRAKHEIYYFLTKTRKEVDFLTRDLQGKRYLFQVCWNMEDSGTQQRETTALQEAEEELKIKGLCITPANYLTSFLPLIRKF